MKVSKKWMRTAVVMGLVIVTMAGCGKSKSSEKKDAKDYTPLIEQLCDAKENADLDEFLSLFGSMEALMATVVTQDVMDDTLEGYTTDCGENISLEYEIAKAEKATDEEVISYQESVTLFGEEGTVDRAYDLTVDVTVTGDSGNSEYTMELSVGEVDGEWIIVNFNDTLLK